MGINMGRVSSPTQRQGGQGWTSDANSCLITYIRQARPSSPFLLPFTVQLALPSSDDWATPAAALNPTPGLRRALAGGEHQPGMPTPSLASVLRETEHPTLPQAVRLFVLGSDLITGPVPDS